MDLGDRIRELRGLYGHSQQDLAEKLDVKRPTISTWESQNALPNYKSLKKLSQIYNVSLTYLLDEEYNNTVYEDRVDVKFFVDYFGDKKNKSQSPCANVSGAGEHTSTLAHKSFWTLTISFLKENL